MTALERGGVQGEGGALALEPLSLCLERGSLCLSGQRLEEQPTRSASTFTPSGAAACAAWASALLEALLAVMEEGEGAKNCVACAVPAATAASPEALTSLLRRISLVQMSSSFLVPGGARIFTSPVSRLT